MYYSVNTVKPNAHGVRSFWGRVEVMSEDGLSGVFKKLWKTFQIFQKNEFLEEVSIRNKFSRLHLNPAQTPRKCLAFNKGSVGYRIRYIRLRVLEILFTERKAKKETDGISLPPFRSFSTFSVADVARFP